MVHVPRLTRQLQQLLAGQRVAALGTIADDGAPLVSMVPFAVERALGVFVIHVSDLAAHSRNLQTRPRVSLLVMQPAAPGEPVHALPRVTFDGQARVPAPGGDEWRACRQAYVDRFPSLFPGEHWVALGVGLAAWLVTRKHPSLSVRTLGTFVGAALVARAASGRRRLSNIMRWTPVGGGIRRH